MRHQTWFVALSLALTGSTMGGALADSRLGADSALPPPFELAREGGRLDWNKHNLIAYDKISGRGAKSKRYDVYTMNPDGSGNACVTCRRQLLGLPDGIVGQPAWHPNGRYMVVQVEKAFHPKVLTWAALTPGAGVYNDLWLIDTATNKARLLHGVPLRKGSGVLHPHFSADGTQLSWSEMYQGASLARGKSMGIWKLKVANFVDGASPHLSNIREYEPDGAGFYENHGFSPDGRLLIFTHNSNGGDPFRENNIYTMDLASGRIVQQLTDSGYNEHAVFSPDGTKIAWMTSRDNGASYSAGTDYWVMNADGSDKKRLTCFNVRGNPQWLRKKVFCADLSWNPDGSEFAGYVEVVKIPFEERIYLVKVR